MNTNLKNKVNAFMKCSGMSQVQFAKRAGLCDGTMNRWLNDKRVISAKMEKRKISCLIMRKRLQKLPTIKKGGFHLVIWKRFADSIHADKAAIDIRGGQPCGLYKMSKPK